MWSRSCDPISPEYFAVRPDRLKKIVFARPWTTVVKQWGECLVFKAAGRMFLLISPDGVLIDGVVFKCKPGEFDSLTTLEGVTQAPGCAKRMWVRVSDPDAVPTRRFETQILRSYDLVAGQAARENPGRGERRKRREVKAIVRSRLNRLCATALFVQTSRLSIFPL